MNALPALSELSPAALVGVIAALSILIWLCAPLVFKLFQKVLIGMGQLAIYLYALLFVVIVAAVVGFPLWCIAHNRDPLIVLRHLLVDGHF